MIIFRYVLLNNKWYEKLKSLGSDVGPGAGQSGDQKSIEIINENQTNQDERIMSIVSLIPAQYRNKARLLLSTILPYIHVDSFNRFIHNILCKKYIFAICLLELFIKTIKRQAAVFWIYFYTASVLQIFSDLDR